MTDGSNFRYFKCEGKALDLLHEYRAELETMVDEHTKLCAEFNERAQTQAAEHHDNLRTIWRRMAALVGLDPDTTWMHPDYQIEIRYLEDGFGAILYDSQQPGSLRELLDGSGERAGGPVMMSALDKSKLH